MVGPRYLWYLSAENIIERKGARTSNDDQAVGLKRKRGTNVYMKFHKMDSFDWADFASRYTAISAKHSSPEAELTNERARLSLSPVLGVFGSSPDKQFCRRDNVDQCLAFLNQVSCSMIELLYHCLGLFRDSCRDIPVRGQNNVKMFEEFIPSWSHTNGRVLAYLQTDLFIYSDRVGWHAYMFLLIHQRIAWLSKCGLQLGLSSTVLVA